MFKIFIVLLLILSPYISSAQSFRIIDGDTFYIIEDKTIKIRLYGIDAPEISQMYGIQSKELVASIIQNHKFTVQYAGKDKYRRNIAIINFLDMTLQEELLREGLAYVYPQYCKLHICQYWREVEFEAREAKRNIWSSTGNIKPWDFRKNKY